MRNDGNDLPRWNGLSRGQGRGKITCQARSSRDTFEEYEEVIMCTVFFI